MNELNEIRKRLCCLEVKQNGFIKVDDVKAVITFIEGLMYVKDNKDGTGNMQTVDVISSVC